MKGLEARLKKILPGGKGVWIPMDHGISNYPEVGLENINSTIKKLIDLPPVNDRLKNR